MTELNCSTFNIVKCQHQYILHIPVAVDTVFVIVLVKQYVGSIDDIVVCANDKVTWL